MGNGNRRDEAEGEGGGRENGCHILSDVVDCSRSRTSLTSPVGHFLARWFRFEPSWVRRSPRMQDGERGTGRDVEQECSEWAKRRANLSAATLTVPSVSSVGRVGHSQRGEQGSDEFAFLCQIQM